MEASPARKVVFIHLRKAGGLSVRTAMRANDPRAFKEGHVHMGVTRRIYQRFSRQGYEFFCVVRNPWDAVVSRYRFAQKTKKRFRVPFVEWVRSGRLTDRVSTFPCVLPEITVGGKIVAKVFRFEDGFDQIGDYLGWPISERKQYYGTYDPMGYHTEETIDIIARRCRKDIKVFGWERPTR